MSVCWFNKIKKMSVAPVQILIFNWIVLEHFSFFFFPFFFCLCFVYFLFTVENFPVEMWVSLSGENQLCPKSHLVPNLIRHQTLVKFQHNFARTFCFTNIGSAWSSVTHVCRTLVPQVFCLVCRSKYQGCWDCLRTPVLCLGALWCCVAVRLFIFWQLWILCFIA